VDRRGIARTRTHVVFALCLELGIVAAPASAAALGLSARHGWVRHARVAAGQRHEPERGIAWAAVAHVLPGEEIAHHGALSI
jgi:hypothetical protein